MKFTSGKFTFETNDWQREIKDIGGDNIEILDEEKDKFLIIKLKETGQVKIHVEKNEGIDAFDEKYGNLVLGKPICANLRNYIGGYGYGHVILDPGEWDKVIGKDEKQRVKRVCMEGKCPKCKEDIVIWGQFDLKD